MKKVTITIIELKDIKRIFSLIFDKIIFCFSKPKYKIGTKINMENWGKNLIIDSISKDWEHLFYLYTAKDSNFEFSEGLIDFYMRKHKGEIK